jgi:hypothetical protein
MGKKLWDGQETTTYLCALEKKNTIIITQSTPPSNG